MLTLKELIKGLPFSTATCEEAATRQAGLFIEAAQYRIAKMHNYNTLEMAFEAARAEKAIQIREAARNNGEKLTEGFLAEQLLVIPALNKQSRALAEAKELDEYSRLVVEAYRMRRDALEIVSRLAAGEIATLRSMAKIEQRLQNSPEG